MAVWSEVPLSKAENSQRYDAEYWQPIYLELDNIFESIQCYKILDLAEFVRCGPFGSTLLCETYVSDGVIVIRPFNIKGMTIERTNLAYIDKSECKAKGLHLYKEGDIVFARVGNARCGIIRKFSKELTISPNIIAVRPKCILVNPFFLFVFMNSRLGLMQLERAMKIVAQPTITVDVIKNILVPKVERKKQDAIETIVRQSFAMDDKFQSLFHETEYLLLTELGLTDLDLSHQLFYERSYTEIAAANRFDAEYFQPKYYRVEECITQCGYPVDSLGNFIEPIKNGFDFRDFKEEGTPYIRVGDVKNGEINLDNAKHIAISSDNIRKDINLKVGDVLFTRKGSFGNAAVVRLGQEHAIISSEIMLLRIIDNSIDPDYLATYLNTDLGYQQVERRAHGVAFYSISQPDLAAIKIVCASDELQQRIKQSAQDAYAAREESKRLLEEATHKVEGMILGNEV